MIGKAERIMQNKNGTSREAALDLARRGYAVFPVHSIKPDGQCSCGTKDCGNAGKHPMTQNGLKDASSDPTTVERLFRRHELRPRGLESRGGGNLQPRAGGQ